MKVGDPVEVLDPGLTAVRQIMEKLEGAPVINHHGWVDEILPNGDIMVLFPIGEDDPHEHSQVAPYPPHMVRARAGKRLVIEEE